MRKKNQFFIWNIWLLGVGPWVMSWHQIIIFCSTTQLFRSHISMTSVTSRPMLLFYSQSSLWKRKTFHSDRPWNVHFCLLVELRLPRIDNSTWSRRRRRERCQPSGPATPVQRVSNAADKVERVAGSDRHEWPSPWRRLIDFLSSFHRRPVALPPTPTWPTSTPFAPWSRFRSTSRAVIARGARRARARARAKASRARRRCRRNSTRNAPSAVSP